VRRGDIKGGRDETRRRSDITRTGRKMTSQEMKSLGEGDDVTEVGGEII